MSTYDENLSSEHLHVALRAAERLAKDGIDAEVIDLKTLKPLDEKKVLDSVKKTLKVVILQEACRTAGFGAEVAAIIADKAFDYLDAPPKVVGGAPTPMPYAQTLEQAVVPQVEDVVNAIKEIV